MQPDSAAGGLDQLGGVVAHAVLENGLHVLNVGNVFRRIAFDDDDVGLLAGDDAADLVGNAEPLRAVEGSDLNGLNRREAGLDQEFDFAKDLFPLLLRKGLLTNDELDRALEEKQQGELLGEALVRLRICFEDDIARVLADGTIIVVLSNSGMHRGTTWASYVAQRLVPRK